jgi:hypothetical protein
VPLACSARPTFPVWTYPSSFDAGKVADLFDPFLDRHLAEADVEDLGHSRCHCERSEVERGNLETHTSPDRHIATLLAMTLMAGSR